MTQYTAGHAPQPSLEDDDRTRYDGSRFGSDPETRSSTLRILLLASSLLSLLKTTDRRVASAEPFEPNIY